jgi:hypothetical protein
MLTNRERANRSDQSTSITKQQRRAKLNRDQRIVGRAILRKSIQLNKLISWREELSHGRAKMSAN